MSANQAEVRCEECGGRFYTTRTIQDEEGGVIVCNPCEQGDCPEIELEREDAEVVEVGR